MFPAFLFDILLFVFFVLLFLLFFSNVLYTTVYGISGINLHVRIVTVQRAFFLYGVTSPPAYLFVTITCTTYIYIHILHRVTSIPRGIDKSQLVFFREEIGKEI